MMTSPRNRIAQRFAALQATNCPGLVTFISAGDPDYDTSLDILRNLPAAGADIIELGMPFSDPMTDGPSIQQASRRALHGGQNMQKTLAMARAFRDHDRETPLVLMGYYNPIHRLGVARFVAQASDAGVDGLIVVDLPPEHDEEIRRPAQEYNLDVIRMATPTTDEQRLPQVLQDASGFLYYVSSTGVTGATVAMPDEIETQLSLIRQQTDLLIGVGFGIRTAEQARGIAGFADAIVVGSALTDCLQQAERPVEGKRAVLERVRTLADAIAEAR